MIIDGIPNRPLYFYQKGIIAKDIAIDQASLVVRRFQTSHAEHGYGVGSDQCNAQARISV